MEGKLYVNCGHPMEDEGTEIAEGNQLIRVEASEFLEMA